MLIVSADRAGIPNIRNCNYTVRILNVMCVCACQMCDAPECVCVSACMRECVHLFNLVRFAMTQPTHTHTHGMARQGDNS